MSARALARKELEAQVIDFKVERNSLVDIIYLPPELRVEIFLLFIEEEVLEVIHPKSGVLQWRKPYLWLVI